MARRKKKASKAKARTAKAPRKSKVPAERGKTAAHRMATRQREISVSEFFTKNRHLLGFDNPRKALLTTVKEAVDNSLDACEEAEILPEVRVEIHPAKKADRYRVVVEDNGPGILKSQLPQVFARLLYGSKFHTLKQQRGQQGIGISAAAMYGQLTTGRPATVISRVGRRHPAHQIRLKIDTARNRPEILSDQTVEWDRKHGTRIEFEMEARPPRGKQSVEEYLKQTAIANPHVQLTFRNWEGEEITFERATKKMPPIPKEIRPHPYGLEIGALTGMIKASQQKKLGAFLRNEFSRVGPKVAKEIVRGASLTTDTWLKSLSTDQIEAIHQSIQKVKIIAPSTDCVAPIGEAGLVAGLKKEIEADLYVYAGRSPKIYRGNPFLVEIGVAYGGALAGDEPVRLMRLANRVPLQYQPGACATTKAVVGTDWRNYLLMQPRDSMPVGPMIILVHLASVWVPFTSEAKEAIAHYPEIIKEIRLGLQEAGRKVAMHIRKRRREADAQKKKAYIEAYLPAIGEALRDILTLSEPQTNTTVARLKDVLERSRKM